MSESVEVAGRINRVRVPRMAWLERQAKATEESITERRTQGHGRQGNGNLAHCHDVGRHRPRVASAVSVDRMSTLIEGSKLRSLYSSGADPLTVDVSNSV